MNALKRVSKYMCARMCGKTAFHLICGNSFYGDCFHTYRHTYLLIVFRYRFDESDKLNGVQSEIATINEVIE